MDKKKILIVLGLVGLGVLTAHVVSAKDDSPDLLITDHDTVYDYRLSNGTWYTRRKGSELWLDMKTTLSPENYSMAISRLTAYLNQ